MYSVIDSLGYVYCSDISDEFKAEMIMSEVVIELLADHVLSVEEIDELDINVILQ